MTYFFALPDEVSEWLESEVSRLGLWEDVEVWSRTTRVFLWPRGFERPPRARGVVVEYPMRYDTVLTSSRVSWQPSGFAEPFASQGRRLSQQLVRSFRQVAVIPLFALSFDRANRGDRPTAFGSPRAVETGIELRQWRDAAATFEP